MYIGAHIIKSPKNQYNDYKWNIQTQIALKGIFLQVCNYFIATVHACGKGNCQGENDQGYGTF